MNNYDPGIPILREMLGLSIINKLEECGFKELENPRAELGLSRPDLAEKIFVRSHCLMERTISGRRVRQSSKDGASRLRWFATNTTYHQNQNLSQASVERICSRHSLALVP